MNALQRVQGRALQHEFMLLAMLAMVSVAMVAGIYSYQLLKQQQLQQRLQVQRTLADSRASDIEHYMDMQLGHLTDSSRAYATKLAMMKLDHVFKQGVDSASYHAADADFRPGFATLQHHWSYYDIFLINPAGDIVFTMQHESDFATNLQHGVYRDTGLAHVWHGAITMLSPDLSTFAYYQPSDEPAAFMAAPIMQSGTLLGVLAFQLNTDAFYAVAGNLAGLAETGEIIMAQPVSGAKDGHAVLLTAPTRSDPKAAFHRKIALGSDLARPIQEATEGNSGQGFMRDLDGVPVVAAWTYLPSLKWGLVAKIDQHEVLSSLTAITQRLVMVMLASLLLVLALMAWRGRSLTRPLSRLTQAATDMTHGSRFEMDLPINTGIAEINLLSAAFNEMSREILSYQNELETKVEERTVALRRLQVAIEQSHDVVMITDRDAIIEYVNPAFEEISGYRADDAIGQRANLVKSGKMSKAFYERMWNTILAGKNWQADFINKNKAGDFYEVEQVISPIKNEDGNISGFVSVQRDITGERNKQKQLEHTQRLESLGVLAGGIAHDFNNLLTAILGNAGLARRRMGDASPIAENLSHIEEASERAADLCKQMLAYSGKGKFVVLPLNLSDLVREIIKLLNVSISKNVSLRTDLDDALPAIEADKAQMQQVIMNLVINASEAIEHDQGNIVMHTGVMDVDAAYLENTHIHDPLPAGRYVFLEISDDGCGMNDEVQKKLFDPFFTTKFTGRGLGMSAILGIVRGHKGAIKVYSEAGKGTTFKVLFPAASTIAAQVTPMDQGSQTTWTKGGLVLVVDDEPSLRQTAQLMLEDIGFEVCTACDGVEAVEIFSSLHERIDVVLLDMTMPRMDGKTAFREMRRIDPDATVILSSGYNEQDATSHFAGKGLAGFIQKPYRVAALRQKLMDILSKDQ